jgi:hypothetical protein
MNKSTISDLDFYSDTEIIVAGGFYNNVVEKIDIKTGKTVYCTFHYLLSKCVALLFNMIRTDCTPQKCSGF